MTIATTSSAAGAARNPSHPQPGVLAKCARTPGYRLFAAAAKSGGFAPEDAGGVTPSGVGLLLQRIQEQDQLRFRRGAEAGVSIARASGLPVVREDGLIE